MNESLAGLAALLVGCAIAAPVSRAADVKANPEFTRRASWSIPQLERVREAAFEWLESRQVDADSRAQIDALWSSASVEGEDAYLLDLVVATLAAGDPRARALADVCAKSRSEAALPEVDWLADDQTAPFARDNLHLVYGRWLVQEMLYDEALGQLTELKPQDVVDPAALLFYQGVVHHRMLHRDEGLAAIERLLENESALPVRYASLAPLIQADLQALKEDSLDHIARRMDDIRRRLDLGRAGKKVRDVEDGVIASLDKLIDEMEKQQQAAAAKAGGRGARPITPMPDSRPAELKAPGDVAGKPIGDGRGWGDLPPRQRTEALQQISKEFPAHYRDMIEQYFRKLASDSSENQDR